MKPCPHCKQHDQGFVIKGQMIGSVEKFYDGSGNYEELNLDRAYWKTESKTVRCANCNKIRRDVMFDGKKVVDIK